MFTYEFSSQSAVLRAYQTYMILLSTHSSLIIGGSPLLLSDGGSPPASPASLLAGLLRRRDPSVHDIHLPHPIVHIMYISFPGKLFVV